jgi:hypothetical protein
MIEAVKRCARLGRVGKGDLTGAELKEWRLSQPGTFVHRNHTQTGWTQAEAAKWAGVAVRSWKGWELEQRPVPAHIVRRVVEHGMSLREKIGEILR